VTSRNPQDASARTVVARARTPNPSIPEGFSPSPLPLAIQAILGGGVATVLLIVTAIVLRAPLPDFEKRAVTAGSASVARAPAAPPSASAPPAVSTTAPAGPVPPPSDAARELAARFSHLMNQGTRFEESVSALDELLTADPVAASRREIRELIVKLAQRIMLVKNSKAPDRFFALITERMGSTGFDILFELETTRGSSLGAARASQLLEDATIRSRGTPALQIAYEIRHTRNCEDLRKLLDRAQADGDGRTLGQMLILGRLCGRRDSDCCLNDQQFKDTLAILRKRVN
jgi:hypothetical protein